MEAALGIGKIFSSVIHSVARSPELDTKLFGYAILGFALMEAIALFALMIAFLIFFQWTNRDKKNTGTAAVDDLAGADLHSLSFFEPFAPPFGYAGTKCPLTTNQQTSSGWVLPVTPRRRFSSWDAVSRSRGRFAPCPRIWVICSHTMLLQSDLAGERSQFATENKTASECTFVRFFSTKHGSLWITVGRWLPKETPIRSAPRLGGIYLIPITRRGSL
uniref:V-ATPase proteolipid subunit C-like domain-containing protein n=1 Tax=Lactuca sativa TaxID=4236 RepID=A0A9R1XCN1_LACSA|nr:hypothetical protein LSAT_V11C500284740 [Lactuca sativa]